MVEVVLRAVRVDVGSSTPLLLLEEVTGTRVLPIFIGGVQRRLFDPGSIHVGAIQRIQVAQREPCLLYTSRCV